MLLNEDGANTAPDRGVAALRAVVHALSRPKGAKVTLTLTLTLSLSLTPSPNP